MNADLPTTIPAYLERLRHALAGQGDSVHPEGRSAPRAPKNLLSEKRRSCITDVKTYYVHLVIYDAYAKLSQGYEKIELYIFRFG